MRVSLTQDSGAAKGTMVEVVLKCGGPHQRAAHEQGPFEIPSLAVRVVAVAVAVGRAPAPRGQQGRGGGGSSSWGGGRQRASFYGGGGGGTVQHHD